MLYKITYFLNLELVKYASSSIEVKNNGLIQTTFIRSDKYILHKQLYRVLRCLLF